MRTISAFVCFAILVALLVGMWAHQFAPLPGAVALGGGDLIATGTAAPGFHGDGGRLIMAAGGRPRHVAFTIPGTDGARNLHVRFQASAIDLVRGGNLWEDGRLFIEWRTPAGETLAFSPLNSARGTESGKPTSVVVHSPATGAQPLLRLENLGASGTYIVDQLEITPARERAVWSVGRWWLVVGFVVCIAMLGHNTKKPAPWRGLAAGIVWVLVAVNYVVPGPWETTRPFAVPFVFSPEEKEPPAAAQPTEAPVLKGGPNAVVAAELGKLPDPDHLGLRLKRMLPSTRPLLHVALLFAPTLAIAWFVGTRRALVPGLLLSCSIEAAQVLFGFGFGWDDVGDLIFNGLGIAAALWAHHRFSRAIHSRLPVPFPEPA